MAVLGLSCGLQDLWSLLQHARSSSCNMWDPLPWRGTELRSLHWEHRVLANGPLGKSPVALFKIFFWLPSGLLRFLITFRMSFSIYTKKTSLGDILSGTVVKNLHANAGTWVPSLVKEDYTCHAVTKPMCHHYWACILKPISWNYWACMLSLLEPACPRAGGSKRSHCSEKSMHYNERSLHVLQPEKV